MICNPFRKKNPDGVSEASASVSRSGNAALVSLDGDWILKNSRTPIKGFLKSLKGENVASVSFESRKFGCFDSSFIAFLLRIYDFCAENGISFDIESLPEKPRALLKLAVAVPPKKTQKSFSGKKGIFDRFQDSTERLFYKFNEQFGFFGELVLASVRLFLGKARFRSSDMAYEVQRAGPDALPIVGLISFLVGLILAFVGANILAQYGSEIFVADMVGLAMVREMGVIMVAIVMAGRTGAAYAAELGSMKINEEIAAFRTFGISPLEFLVIPRIIALIAMFPLLTVFADFIGMLGGFFIGWSMFDINYDAYMNRTLATLSLSHCAVGVLKSFFFGIIVAVVGCMKGMTCGSNAEAVGNATTSSVVTSITLIIVADAVFAVIFNIFGI